VAVRGGPLRTLDVEQRGRRRDGVEHLALGSQDVTTSTTRSAPSCRPRTETRTSQSCSERGVVANRGDRYLEDACQQRVRKVVGVVDGDVKDAQAACDLRPSDLEVLWTGP
jgi:hypothetical protein